MARMRRVELFYDVVCPYAYLGHTQIEALCERMHAALVWKPFLLGGVFRAIGTPDVPADSMPESKARLNRLDMDRWAAHFGVPLRMPANHPRRTVLAMRAILASGDFPKASKALFRAYWVEARDVSQPEVVREALDGAGLDGAKCVEAASEPKIKDELRERTAEAASLGLFGVPAFLVTGDGEAAKPQLFWGQDRLHFVERALEGWHV